MRLLPILAFVLALLLIGCDSDSGSVEAGEGLVPVDAQYAWSVKSRLLETDSLFFREKHTARVRTISRNAEVAGLDSLIEIEASMTGVGSAWYKRTDERLTEVAYSSSYSGGLITPRGVTMVPDVYSVPLLVQTYADRLALARSAVEDSVIVRDSPRVVYALPLEVGSSWIAFTSPFGSTREVVGRARVTVEAGAYDCFVIRTEIDIVRPRDQFEWFDYVSPEHGLVLRTVESVHELRDPDSELDGQLLRTRERLERVGGR